MPNYFVIMLKFEFQINPALYVYRDAGHEIFTRHFCNTFASNLARFFDNTTPTARNKFPYPLYTNVVGESFGGHHTHTLQITVANNRDNKIAWLTSQGWSIVEQTSTSTKLATLKHHSVQKTVFKESRSVENT